MREIAREIGRDPGTVSRELRRNAATRSGKQVHRAVLAHREAQQAAKRPKTAKLVNNDGLREYVQDRLAGNVRRPDGTIVSGPPPPGKGLNKPHRQDRGWSTSWRPEQIAQRLTVEFPDDESMRISHEAIYQLLFIEGTWCAQARAGHLSAHGPRAAGAAGPVQEQGAGSCDRGCRPQRAPR